MQQIESSSQHDAFIYNNIYSHSACISVFLIVQQFAVTQIVGFIILLPIMYATEGNMASTFFDKLKTDSALQFNLVMSGLAFYIYNELATYTLKVTGAVTASVANTAKRVIVMVYMAAVTGKALTTEQKIGSGIAISGVLLYSLIDDLLGGKKKTKTA